MDLSAVGGDTSDVMWKQNSGGKDKGQVRHLATTNGLWRAASKQVTINLAELPNTMFMVVISWLWNGNNQVLSPNQLQALYTDVRHWEKLINLLNKMDTPKSHTS